ncbi:MAG TPA: peptidoglycan-binding protein [Gaiellaceae bacterium]|nr:peptidoglycan-binding protein [Gaiellaceae bacterium]
MRTGRYVAFASVLAALVAAAPAEAVPAPHIAGAQVALRAEGLYRGPIDGIAGPQTDRAVRAFQRRARIAVDGVTGPKTRDRLGRLGRPLFGKRAMRRGMVGWDVSVLQFLLKRRGVAVAGIDGIYGQATRRAVRSFQRRAGLTADGVAGPATARALTRATATRARAAPKPARGASRAEVRQMLGYWALRYGVSPRLARALAWMESGFQWNITSRTGAWGVMQVMPATWQFVEDVLTGRDFRRSARGNVRVGILYLRHLIRQFGGNRRLALAAYYQGPAGVRRHGLYRETRVYVRAILALQHRF